jgi:hypothetical protein
MTSTVAPTWTRDRFEAWLRSKEAPATVIAPPYRIEPCTCGDLNCHGWRLVPVTGEPHAFH